MQLASQLRELTCQWDHIGGPSVICHPAKVTFLPLLQPTETGILDSATPEGCKAELTQLVWFHTKVVYVTRPNTVTHSSTNQSQCTVTSFMR